MKETKRERKRRRNVNHHPGVNMTNGHEGKVLEGAIATRYMDLRVPIEPPPIDFAKKKKKKDPRKERMDKEAEREKERKRKEEEKRLQKQVQHLLLLFAYLS